MSSAVDRLLGLEALGDDVFGATIPARGMPRLFGGQVAAQALLAACRTVEDLRPPHSLHGYFILGGKPGVPLRHEVDRTRDAAVNAIVGLPSPAGANTLVLEDASSALALPATGTTGAQFAAFWHSAFD